jgi:hypothetical protein
MYFAKEYRTSISFVSCVTIDYYLLQNKDDKPEEDSDSQKIGRLIDQSASNELNKEIAL